jgi:hypothetical protein
MVVPLVLKMIRPLQLLHLLSIRIGAPVLGATLALSASACAKAYIPNTDVEDSSRNRKVISFCEDYRHAVEDRNVGQLLKMASPHYHEDGGNISGGDDVDFTGLRDYLTSTFLKTEGIRYEIRYRRVTFTEANRIHIDYTYAGSYRLPGVKTDTEWKHTVADNRLELVPDGDSFKIVAGM